MAMTMEKIWQIVEEGQARTKYTTQDEAILVLGLRGSGKTTTTLLLTKNDKNLKSVRSVIDPTKLIIQNRDAEKIPRIEFPTLMTDNKTVYYDCPSFGEVNRSLKDLTSAHSMRKLIDRLNSVKFLFTVDYSSVERVDQREKFLDWIKEISKTVKNIDTFQRNIGLVVTQVANPAEMVSDSEIIREIKHFLETVRTLIERDEYDWMLKNYAEKLIDSFLSTENDCNKVTILRRPKEPGSIFKMTYLKEELAAIERMMKSCVASTFDKDNFGYTISDKTQNYVTRLVDRIHGTTNKVLANLAFELRQHFDGRENNYRDTNRLKNEFLEGSNQINLIVSKMGEDMTFRNVGDQLEKSIEEMKFFTAGDDIPIFYLQDEYLKFLEGVSSRKFRIDPSRFKSPLRNVVKYLDRVGMLYRAIIQTYDKLSERDGTKYKENCEGSTMAECLKNSEYYEQIKSLEETVAREGAIGEMLKATSADGGSVVHTKWGESKLTGSFLNTDTIDWTNSQMNSIKIFASKKVYVSNDLLFATPRVNVTIISPVWEILERRKIFFRWFGFEPEFQIGFLGVGRDFVNAGQLTIDGRSKWLANDKREMKSVNLIALEGARIEYENVKPTVGSKTCTFSFQSNYGVNFAPAQGYGPESEPWSPSEYKANTVNEYKRHLISNFNDRIGYQRTREMFQMLDKDPCINNFYTGRGLVNELLQLELEFKIARKDDFLPLYESLKERAFSYAGSKRGDEVERRVARHVYDTATSKIWSLKRDAAKELVTDVGSRINEILQEVEDLRNLEKPGDVKKITQDFSGKIKREIERMLTHIKNNILPGIDAAMGRIDAKTNKLLKEIDAMKASIADHRDKMKKAQEQAKWAGILRILMGVIKGIGVLVSLMTGPAAPAVSAAIVGTATILEQFIPADQPATSSGELPLGAKNIAKLSLEWTEDLEKRNKKGVERALEIVNIGIDSSSACSSELGEIKSKLQEGLKTDKVDFGGLRELMSTKKTTLIKFDKKKAGRLLGTALTAYSSPTYPIDKKDIENQLSNDDKYSDIIAADTEKIEKLAMVQTHINDILKPALKNTSIYLQKAASNVDKDNRVLFNKQQFEMKRTIRNMRESMRGVIAGFKTETEIRNAWDQLKDVMDQLMNVYDQIHDSRDRFQMVDTLGRMKATQKSETTLIADPEMRKDLDTLDKIYLRNVITGKYTRLLEAVKLMTFPFARLYVDSAHNQIGMNPNENGFDKIKRLTESLRTKIMEHRTTLRGGYDDNIVSLFFKRPFFVWRNEDYRGKIDRFFKGDEIVLVADITKGSVLNAVKFNSIRFIVKSDDEKMQKEIDRALSGFRILLTHSGVSRYKCGRRVYVLTSMETQLEFSFAMNGNRPMMTSGSTEKLAAADPILSPYTTWRLRLVPELNSQTNFDALRNYSDRVDLELGGNGSYVVDNSEICNDKLKEHYTVDPTSFPRSSLVERPSSVNGIFDWITSLPRRLLAPKQELQYDEFGYEDYGLEEYPSSSSVDGNLLLLDLLARKCTGLKLNSIQSRSDNETRIQNAFVRSVEMTMKLEKGLEELLKNHYPGEEAILFDPCELIGRLKSNLLNSKPMKLKKIMETFVTENNPLLTKGKFLQDLRAKVKHIKAQP